MSPSPYGGTFMDNQFKQSLINSSFDDILGQDAVKKQLKSALVMQRNIILVGPPGIGKTTLAKNVAKISGNHTPFVRIQGSPDLTAEDLIGDIDPIKAMEFGPSSREAFTKGKIFKANKGVLFFDELNRCSEKLQNALLQVLEEKKATIGSYDVDLDADFIFIGTMNPEDTSTEKLSDVMLDRFDLVYAGYPETTEIETAIIHNKGKKLDVNYPENLLQLTVNYVRQLRDSDKLEKIPSVRATLGLYEQAQSNAFLEGKQEVELKHIFLAVKSVISHRIRLKPSVKYLKTPSEFALEKFSQFCEHLGYGKQGYG